MHKRSRQIGYYSFFLSCLLILTITSCTINYTHSEQWKTQQIEKMYNQYAQEFPEVKSISVKELKKLLQQNKIILVDVRTPKERAVSIIPGAITVDKFKQNLVIYKDFIIVPYCTIGYRSGKYAEKLQQKGFKVLNFKGSILAWTHAGGILVNSQGETRKVHVFGHKWSLTPDNYQPVW